MVRLSSPPRAPRGGDLDPPGIDTRNGRTGTLDGWGIELECRNPGLCGNGSVDLGESCHDGGTERRDGCSSSCKRESGHVWDGAAAVATCGNATIDEDELCDDGNADGSDGCSPTCTLEDENTCVGEPSECRFGGSTSFRGFDAILPDDNPDGYEGSFSVSGCPLLGAVDLDVWVDPSVPEELSITLSTPGGTQVDVHPGEETREIERMWPMHFDAALGDPTSEGGLEMGTGDWPVVFVDETPGNEGTVSRASLTVRCAMP